MHIQDFCSKGLLEMEAGASTTNWLSQFKAVGAP